MHSKYCVCIEVSLKSQNSVAKMPLDTNFDLIGIPLRTDALKNSITPATTSFYTPAAFVRRLLAVRYVLWDRNGTALTYLSGANSIIEAHCSKPSEERSPTRRRKQIRTLERRYRFQCAKWQSLAIKRAKKYSTRNFSHFLYAATLISQVKFSDRSRSHRV